MMGRTSITLTAVLLAAMSPRRAWRRMTPEERLLKTGEAELAVYGAIVSPDARSAYQAHAARTAVAEGSGEALGRSGTSVLRAPAAGGQNRARAVKMLRSVRRGQAARTTGTS